MRTIKILPEKYRFSKIRLLKILTKVFCFVFFTLLLFPYVSDAITINAGTGVSISATVPSGGGGNNNNNGGGGGSSTVPTSVIFLGRAYPLSHVIILKDGQEIISTIAGPDANFNVSVLGLSGGTYNFSVLGEDSNGVRSAPFNVSVLITPNTATTISGIFIAPTIAVDKTEVKRGDNLAIFGRSAPQSQVTISVASEDEVFEKVSADINGAYLYNFDTSLVEVGEHTTKAKATLGDAVSPFGQGVNFTVGDKTVPKKETCALKGDLNGDCRVNLIDFSILAYWYHRSNPPQKVDLNGDGKITLTDFSILAYYWTG
jgi:hypothetical protein